jgi:hypothetical protein
VYAPDRSVMVASLVGRTETPCSLSSLTRKAALNGNHCTLTASPHIGQRWSQTFACVLCMGLLSGPHLESYDEVADTAEDGKEADPKDQQGGSGGDVLL